jgi:hypothetical protein
MFGKKPKEPEFNEDGIPMELINAVDKLNGEILKMPNNLGIWYDYSSRKVTIRRFSRAEPKVIYP